MVHFPFLSKDAGGDFHYFGVLNSLMVVLEKVWCKFPDRHFLKLQINFDGIPLFKSTSVQFWPILGILQDYKMLDEDRHVATCPLIERKTDMVGGFPRDYMHLVCLGVMQRILVLWLSSGLLCVRLSSRLCHAISDSLEGLRFYIPSDFARKPRPLAHRLRWKATELRQFLLYTGPVVLCNVLASPVYSHFMLLSVAIHILLSRKFCFVLNDFAHTCLVSFVEQCGVLYGQEFVCCNVHDVKQHGNLDEFSAFPFENYLGSLKKLVRRPCNPLAQVIRRPSGEHQQPQT
ncbi:DNA-binding protein P3A2 [Labeo rohita]|uniref:DNA-binding protein P3A2 n=1 Tax=Labeo rohita TaxID=84645 RepID=A0ABQ8L8G1_LABRO|nr:DNA-binding protein P3A2 [Labeo rohita]